MRQFISRAFALLQQSHYVVAEGENHQCKDNYHSYNLHHDEELVARLLSGDHLVQDESYVAAVESITERSARMFRKAYQFHADGKTCPMAMKLPTDL